MIYSLKIYTANMVTIEATRCHSGVFIVNFAEFENLNARWNTALSMCFRVGSTSPVTFKMKLSVTTVNYSFQLFPIFCHKKLHLRCCIGLELSIVISSTKILKGTGWHHHDGVISRGNIKNSKVFCIKLSFLYLISNGKIELISTH